jgi:hypothetical protein
MFKGIGLDISCETIEKMPNKDEIKQKAHELSNINMFYQKSMEEMKQQELKYLHKVCDHADGSEEEQENTVVVVDDENSFEPPKSRLMFRSEVDEIYDMSVKF